MAKVSVGQMNMVPEPDLPPPVQEDEGLTPPAPPGETRRIVASEEEIAAVEAANEESKPEPQEEVTVLSDEERELFRSLITIGRRVKTIDVFGHSVTIQTLTSKDEMRIGLHTKEYLDTRGFARAYQCAVVAAGLVEFDGQELYTPLSDKEGFDTIFAKRFEKVQEFYPIVVSEIYNQILKAEAEFVEIGQKLGKIPG